MASKLAIVKSIPTYSGSPEMAYKFHATKQQNCGLNMHRDIADESYL